MSKKFRILNFILIMGVVSFLSVGGCNSDDGEDEDDDEIVDILCSEPNIDTSVCNPDNGPFSLEIDNEFFPLVVGSESILEGVDGEGTEIMIVITVLDETEIVAGIETRVVEEDEFEDGERVETSWNYFAQAPDGTVCYFGEDVDDFENGVVVGHDGVWRAGEGGNLPGIIMPANPDIGDIFMQENAPGIALDQAEVIALGELLELGELGDFEDTLTTEDCNPFDGGVDEKVYVSGIGIAKDADAELVSFEPGDG